MTLEELRAKTDGALKDPAEREFWISAVKRILEHDPNFFTNLPEEEKAKILGMPEQKKLAVDTAKVQGAFPVKVAPKTEKQLPVEEKARLIASAIGEIAASRRILPMFNSNPKKTVYGIASLVKMAREMPLGKTESEIEAAKDAVRAVAAESSMGVDGVQLLPTLGSGLLSI